MSELDSSLPNRSPIWWICFAVCVFVFIGGVLQLGRLRTPPAAYRIEAQHYVKHLVLAIKAYRAEFDSVPNGSNAEILRALSGGNARKRVFFEVPAQRISPEGELLDPWRVPYHIDTSDPEKPRIYSFGPNKRDESGAEQSDDVVKR